MKDVFEVLDLVFERRWLSVFFFVCFILMIVGQITSAILRIIG